MKHSIITLLVLLTAWIAAQGINTKIIDKETGNPIAGVTAFSDKGVILGISNSLGEVDLGGVKNFPVTIRSIGFNPVVCDRPTKEIRLTHAEYQLAEVIVTPDDNMVKHVVCYLREYVSSTTHCDTTLHYNEHMVDFFLTDKKIKKFKPSKGPRILSSKLRTRKIYNDGRDSVFIPDAYDDTFSIPLSVLRIPSGVIPPKYCHPEGNEDTPGPKIKGMLLGFDVLADKKNHTWSPWQLKAIGCTTDVTEAQMKLIVRPRADCTFLEEDVQSLTLDTRMLAKGKIVKWMFDSKTPIDIRNYYELYPVEVTYLTPEEAKDLQKNPPATLIKKAPAALPLTPGMRYIVEHAR